MDEKVLDVLIKRVEEASQMYLLHKNKAWEECLESDKKKLREYCLKNVKKGSKFEGLKNVLGDSGYMGCKEVMNSGKGNIELIPQNSRKGEKHIFYKFHFKCLRKLATVKVNGITYVDRDNLSLESIPDNIQSFVVVTPNVDFTWIGAYYTE